MDDIVVEEKTPTIKEIQELRKSIGWDPRSEAAWKRIIEKSIFFSVYDGDLLVGIGRMVEDGTMCALYDHCIRREYQRKGIGATLTRARVKKAKEIGCKYIHGFPSDQATGMFKKLGFEIVEGVELIND